MKRIITILMTLAIMGSPLYASTVTKQQPDDKDIKLNTSEKEHKGADERSLFFVFASLNSDSSIIEINIFGCGNSAAYLYDGTGTLVSSTTISIEDGFGTLSVPETSGLYYIVINSDRCYSQGSFVK